VLAHAGAADESFGVVMLIAGMWVGWIAVSRIRGRSFSRIPLTAAWAGVSLALVLVAGAAVLPARVFPRTDATATASGPRPASTATIAIERPAANSDVTTQDLEVVLRLEGGTIVDATSTDLAPDTGHVHLSIDGVLVSMTTGLTQSLSVRALDPGEHTLLAEFVAADHAPFDPRVTASVTFVRGAT
jgi:hypothetical protein